jgi:hypothetical protein
MSLAIAGEEIPDIPATDCNLGLARLQLEGVRQWSRRSLANPHRKWPRGTSILVQLGDRLAPVFMEKADRRLQQRISQSLDCPDPPSAATRPAAGNGRP